MAEYNKIFLVGYMGCGKSTLARRLANRIGWQFVDTDSEAERLEGASVSDIFCYEGEEHFRRLEREIIDRLISSSEPMIISTGGGLPIWSDNMERMNSSGLTIFIDRSAQSIASRLSPYGRQRRPRLRGLSDEQLVEFMSGDIASRRPYYERAALRLDCDSVESDRELIWQIVQHIKR